MNAGDQVVQMNPRYIWIRGRELEQTYPGDRETGIWPISGARVAYGWGNVPVDAWPNGPSSTEWPPREPEGLDRVAKKYRILFYQRVRDFVDCKLILARPHPVGAAFEITEQWFNAPGGRIDEPHPNDKIIGSHAVCLLGVCKNGSTIKFVNSWGEKWGDRGFGYLPSSYFDHRIVSAWTFEIAQRKDESTDFIQYIRLGFRSVLGDTVHVREIFDSKKDERLAWAIGVQRGSILDVEDLFVRPNYRGRGYGHDLSEMIMKMSQEMHLGIRVWFSHADQNGPLEAHLCKSMGLTIVPSGMRWARFVATDAASTAIVGEPLSKPTIWRAAGELS